VVNLIGEKKVSRLEKVAEVFSAIANGGLGKLYNGLSKLDSDANYFKV
jgi:hypothetical protein